MEDQFDLADFIKDSSELFLVLGVFAAISVYTQDLKEGTGLADVYLGYGHGGSLLIVILLTYLVYKEMKKEFGSWSDLLRGHLRKENGELMMFTLSYYLLLWSIVWVVFEQTSVPHIIILLLSLISTFGVVMFALNKIEEFLDSNIQLMTALSVLSLISIIISSHVIIYIVDNYNLVGLGELSIDNAVMMAPTSLFFISGITLLFSIVIGSISVLALLFGLLRRAVGRILSFFFLYLDE